MLFNSIFICFKFRRGFEFDFSEKLHLSKERRAGCMSILIEKNNFIFLKSKLFYIFFTKNILIEAYKWTPNSGQFGFIYIKIPEITFRFLP